MIVGGGQAVISAARAISDYNIPSRIHIKPLVWVRNP